MAYSSVVPFRCLLFLVLFLFLSCKDVNTTATKSANKKVSPQLVELKGLTMGTSYSIKYVSNSNQSYQEKIDKILAEINSAVSTYEPASLITKLNKGGLEEHEYKSGQYPDRHLIENIKSSQEVFDLTDGHFDPSIMPIVNYWGFGYTEKRAITKIDSAKVKGLLKHVGFEQFKLREENKSLFVKKSNKENQLDFSAIAKGYAVDYVARFLETHAIHNYMVEIGGEVKVDGKKLNGSPWAIGINTPLEDANPSDIQWIVEPGNKSMASSGNYRIFYDTGEFKYGHEINPLTGFPEMTDLLSVSVIHKKCMVADAYATAFMIMGLDASLDLVESIDGLECCFIVLNDGKLESKFSTGFESYLKK